MGKTPFKRLLRSPEKKDARAVAASEKPWETKDIANAGEKLIAPDAAEPSPDADRPKSSCPDVGVSVAGNADSGQSGLSSGDESRQRDENASESAPSSDQKDVAVYTDKSACRYLRVHRRVLAEARTQTSRGVDWDAVGEEVGMTKAWIDAYAIKHGIVPDFAAQLERVSGKYVSVRLVGTTVNHCICIVELEATGTRMYARTRNIMAYPIHYKDVFDCLRVDAPGGSRLEWIAAPNDMPY